jgi:hypothetical protein
MSPDTNSEGWRFRLHALADYAHRTIDIGVGPLADEASGELARAREARAAAAVKNKHLVPILDAGEADGRYYLASAYAPGGSLADRLELEGALSVRDTVRIAACVGEGSTLSIARR